jgi:hypothetical protein
VAENVNDTAEDKGYPLKKIVHTFNGVLTAIDESTDV